MAWATSTIAAIAAATTAATGAYVALKPGPKAPELPAAQQSEDLNLTAQNAARERRRQMMGGGVASTILSQTAANDSGYGQKKLLGS